jgi:hypothetical protein
MCLTHQPGRETRYRELYMEFNTPLPFGPVRSPVVLFVVIINNLGLA